ncbi:Hypothetical protein HVR_LOCUS675 [uncultured virus]|nr:Hypothetical protein HVR_LOCUS675 [uncultured virus]
MSTIGRQILKTLKEEEYLTCPLNVDFDGDGIISEEKQEKVRNQISLISKDFDISKLPPVHRHPPHKRYLIISNEVGCYFSGDKIIFLEYMSYMDLLSITWQERIPINNNSHNEFSNHLKAWCELSQMK